MGIFIHRVEHRIGLLFVSGTGALPLQLNHCCFSQVNRGFDHPVLLRLKVFDLQVPFDNKSQSRHLAGPIADHLLVFEPDLARQSDCLVASKSAPHPEIHLDSVIHGIRFQNIWLSQILPSSKNVSSGHCSKSSSPYCDPRVHLFNDIHHLKGYCLTLSVAV